MRVALPREAKQSAIASAAAVQEGQREQQGLHARHVELLGVVRVVLVAVQGLREPLFAFVDVLGVVEIAPIGCDAVVTAQVLRAGHLAAQAIAHSNGELLWRGLPLLHHIKVVIKSGDLVHLGLRHAHLLSQRGQMGGR